jgi:single-stranded-DNA-specific exonuclease
LSSTIARLLVARGIATAEHAHEFLSPSLSHLHSPYLMAGLRQAVERLHAAIARGETIFIYGDYDVDGTTAIVILKTALEICGGKVEYHVPHRIKEGYGMRAEVVERAGAEGVSLIVSVDTGIRAGEVVRRAAALGIDVIVTDHRLPEAELPPALAVLKPNQPGCCYPEKNLCGVESPSSWLRGYCNSGLAWKLRRTVLLETGRHRHSGRRGAAHRKIVSRQARIGRLGGKVKVCAPCSKSPD